MIPYLLLTSLLIPVNIWAAITPHLHSDISMRILHAVSVLVLLPLLNSLWRDRQKISKVPAIILAVFTTILAVVNIQISAQGMGVQYGWVGHLMLAVAAFSVEIYFQPKNRHPHPLTTRPLYRAIKTRPTATTCC